MLGIFRVKDHVLDIDEARGGVLAGGAVLNLCVWPWPLAGEVRGDDHIVGRWAGVARILYDFGVSISYCEKRPDVRSISSEQTLPRLVAELVKCGLWEQNGWEKVTHGQVNVQRGVNGESGRCSFNTGMHSL